MQAFLQESIQEAIENARLPDEYLGYTYRDCGQKKAQKRPREAKTLAKNKLP